MNREKFRWNDVELLQTYLICQNLSPRWKYIKFSNSFFIGKIIESLGHFYCKSLQFLSMINIPSEIMRACLYTILRVLSTQGHNEDNIIETQLVKESLNLV